MRQQLAPARLEGQRIVVLAQGRQDGPVSQRGAQRRIDLLQQPGQTDSLCSQPCRCEKAARPCLGRDEVRRAQSAAQRYPDTTTPDDRRFRWSSGGVEVRGFEPLASSVRVISGSPPCQPAFPRVESRPSGAKLGGLRRPLRWIRGATMPGLGYLELRLTARCSQAHGPIERLALSHERRHSHSGLGDNVIRRSSDVLPVPRGVARTDQDRTISVQPAARCHGWKAFGTNPMAGPSAG
jgi:hypothetical protein